MQAIGELCEELKWKWEHSMNMLCKTRAHRSSNTQNEYTDREQPASHDPRGDRTAAICRARRVLNQGLGVHIGSDHKSSDKWMIRTRTFLRLSDIWMTRNSATGKSESSKYPNLQLRKAMFQSEPAPRHYCTLAIPEVEERSKQTFSPKLRRGNYLGR